MQFAEGQSPLDYLEQASICRATAIKHELNDAHLHYLLGQTLEEHYYATEMYGLRKKVKNQKFTMFFIKVQYTFKANAY